MTAAMMTSSSASLPSFSGTKAVAKPGLSLRQWVEALRSAVAMANAVPATGRVTTKQMARVRAMAEAL